MEKSLWDQEQTALVWIWKVPLPLNAQVLKAWPPACGIADRWWNFYEVGPSGRQLGHGPRVLEGDLGIPTTFSFASKPPWGEQPCCTTLLTMMCCLTTGPKTMEPTKHDLKALKLSQNKSPFKCSQVFCHSDGKLRYRFFRAKLSRQRVPIYPHSHTGTASS
jgi:hypothetical protein